MAKFSEGQTVRLKRNMEIGHTQIRKATEGQIKRVSGGFASKKYEVKWRGIPFVITHSDKDLIAMDED